MADELKNAREALRSILAEIDGLNVYGYPPSGGAWAYPAFIILSPIRQPRQQLGGSTFRGSFNCILLINNQLDEEAYAQLDEYMEALGPKSIEAVLDADSTWNSNVDWGGLININRSGWRSWNETNYVMADFQIDFIKQVLT